MTPDLTRRNVLKGLTLGAGATLLSPALARVTARASDRAKASPPRLVFFLQSNGMSPGHICPVGWKLEPNGQPPANSKAEVVPLKQHRLHEALGPLEAFKDKLTLVRGLSGMNGAGSADHSGGFAALGCYNGKNGPLSATIDVTLAELLPATFRHVALGLGGTLDTTMNYKLCAAGRGKPVPIVCNPDSAYRSLFGSVAEGAARAAFGRRTRLLDFMADDVKRSRAALVGDEREKFDSYVEAYERLHARQTELITRAEAIRRNAPKLDGRLPADKSSLVLEVQTEIAAAALAAGLTNVVTIASGGGSQGDFGTFPEFGIKDLHAIGHGGPQGDKSPEACFVELRQFHCKLIARLVAALSAVKEGDGTAMDNTLIVYLSDSAEGHHARFQEWPVVLIGDLGGRLKKPGRFVQFPGYKRSDAHRTMASLYLTLLDAIGHPRDTFGAADPSLKGVDQTARLPELLA